MVVSNQDFASAAGAVTNEIAAGTARAALRRNAGLEPAQEDTPLLRDSPANAQYEEVTEWEGYADLEGLKWYRKPSVAWLVPIFFLLALAIGGIIVPKLNLILSLVCRDYLVEKSAADPSFLFTPVLLGGENPQCRIPEVQALVTEFTLYLTILAGILSAIMAPKLGELSDRFGRRKLMLLTSCGAFLSEVTTIIIAKYPDTIHYKWLLAGSVFDGLCGSFTGGMIISYAYSADCTAPPKRAVAFGYLHACLFAGIAVGPLLSAILYKLTGELLTVFYAALGIHVFFLVFLLTIVPESLTKKRQMIAREKHAAEMEGRAGQQATWRTTARRMNILRSLKILFPIGPGSSGRLRANLILLAGVDTCVFGIATGSAIVTVYYTGYQFGWDTGDTSLFVSVVNICRVSGLVFVLPLLNYIVRTRRANRQRRESGFALPEPNSGSDSLDLAIIRGAVFLEFVGYTGYALARTPGVFVLSGIVTACGGMASPTLQSSLTKHVPHNQIGSLLGATGLLHALARIVCPLVFNLIYAQTVGKFTQAVFVTLSACFAVAFSFTWFIAPHVYLKDDAETTANTGNDTNHNPDVILDEEITGL